MKLKCSLSGLDRMKESLLEGVKKGDIARVVLVNTGQLQRRAQQLAPVCTGYLKRSIMSNVTPNEGIVRAMADYAEYVEKGTRFMSAQPYMEPAFNEQKTKFLDDLERLVDKL